MENCCGAYKCVQNTGNVNRHRLPFNCRHMSPSSGEQTGDTRAGSDREALRAGLIFLPAFAQPFPQCSVLGSPLFIVPILPANTHTWCDSRIRGRTQMPQHGHYDLGTCPAQATLRAGPMPGDSPRTCQGQDLGQTYTLPSGSSM